MWWKIKYLCLRARLRLTGKPVVRPSREAWEQLDNAAAMDKQLIEIRSCYEIRR